MKYGYDILKSQGYAEGLTDDQLEMIVDYLENPGEWSLPLQSYMHRIVVAYSLPENFLDMLKDYHGEIVSLLLHYLFQALADWTTGTAIRMKRVPL